jgi:hypothetical protein
MAEVPANQAVLKVPAWVNPANALRCLNVVNVLKAPIWVNPVNALRCLNVVNVLKAPVWVNPANALRNRHATDLVAKMAKIKATVAKNATKTIRIKKRNATKTAKTKRRNLIKRNLKSLTKTKKVKNNFWG